MQRFLVTGLVAVFAMASFAYAERAVDDSGRTTDRRLLRGMENSGLKYRIDDDGDVRLIMELENGRTQLVHVMSKTNTYKNTEVREIWSRVMVTPKARLALDDALYFLHRNSEVKFGAFQVVESGDSVIFIFSATVAADASGEELKDVISMVAKAADVEEEKFTHKDEN